MCARFCFTKYIANGRLLADVATPGARYSSPWGAGPHSAAEDPWVSPKMS